MLRCRWRAHPGKTEVSRWTGNLLLHDNYSEMKQLKTHVIFWFLWVRNPVRLSRVPRLRVSHRLQPRCWPRPKSSQARLGKDVHPGSLVNDHWRASVLHSLLDWGPHFLGGYCLEAPPSVPCHKGLSVGQLITWETVGGWRGAGEEAGRETRGERRRGRAGERVCVSETEVTVFCISGASRLRCSLP